jgi:hypothetical protein
LDTARLVLAGINCGVSDLAKEDTRLVLQAVCILVEVDQVAGRLHQGLVGPAKGCSIDVVLDPLVRRNSVYERCEMPVVPG